MTSWPELPDEIRDAMIARGKDSCRDVYDGVALMETDWLPVRPPVTSGHDYDELTRVSHRVAELILGSCRRRASTVGGLRERLGVPAGRIELLGENDGLGDWLIGAVRADALLEHGVPRLVECNIDSALGGVFDSDSIAQRFLAAYRDDPVLGGAVRTPPAAMDARFVAMTRELGLAENASVVMLFHLDSGYPGTERPKELIRLLQPFCDRGRELGLDLSVYPLEWVERDGTGRLVADGRPVDAVMRMFIPRELEPSNGLEALRGALADDLVRMYLPTATWLLGNKGIYAWLWEDLGAMATEDAELVRRHVPRTEFLTADAVDRIVAQQHELVLKPADDYGGHGVVIGPDTAPELWRTALGKALEVGGHVVQEYIHADPLTMQFLQLSSGRVVEAEVPFCLATYQFDGMAAGAYSRFAPPGAGAVVNLHQGALTSGLVLID